MWSEVWRNSGSLPTYPHCASVMTNVLSNERVRGRGKDVWMDLRKGGKNVFLGSPADTFRNSEVFKTFSSGMLSMGQLLWLLLESLEWNLKE